jgi:hypothetical protein
MLLYYANIISTLCNSDGSGCAAPKTIMDLALSKTAKTVAEARVFWLSAISTESNVT